MADQDSFGHSTTYALQARAMKAHTSLIEPLEYFIPHEGSYLPNKTCQIPHFSKFFLHSCFNYTALMLRRPNITFNVVSQQLTKQIRSRLFFHKQEKITLRGVGRILARTLTIILRPDQKWNRLRSSLIYFCQLTSIRL